jgi:hypothetical protein
MSPRTHLLVIAVFATILNAASPMSVAQDIPDLQTRLERGLKATRPNEFAFIARVVRLVDDERLPLALVNSTYNWAVGKRPPMPYFEQAMRVRAARIGVRL